jgi:iron complex transport system substrate-binding protein
MLFAVGAGPQVVAVDTDSDYPPSAPRTALSGLDPNVEAIAKYRPDLVIVYYNTEGLVHALTSLHIPVLLEPAAATLADAYGQISEIGRATGNATKAQRLITSMRDKIKTLVAEAPRFSSPITYYFEVGVNPYYAVTSQTFIGQILSLFHLRNVADAAPAAAGGYPELSSEYIVKVNPDIIFLADTICCAQSSMTVARRPGWNQITAVKDGAVIGLNDDIASRWGPRVVDLVADIEQALIQLHEARAA